MMERRVLVAVFLSFLVLYAYQALFVPPVPPPQLETASAPQTTASGTAPAAVSPGPAPVEAPPPAAEAPASVIADTSEREIVVETPTVRATLSNRGGRITRWQLKDY